MKRFLIATALTIAFLGLSVQKASAWGSLTISGGFQGSLTIGIKGHHHYHPPMMAPPPVHYVDPYHHHHAYAPTYAPRHAPMPSGAEKLPAPKAAAVKQAGYYYPASWSGYQYQVPTYWYGN